MAVPVLYRHILIAAASGAGKSGVLWAILAGMAPAIRDGLVEVWAIDPKRIELAPGKALFAQYRAGIDENVLVLLNELITVMDERLDRMSATGLRKHIPTIDEPAIVLAIDEVLVLTAFADKELGKEVDRLLRLLMALGRAAAVSVIVLGQDPSKEIMAWRQMATWRIALRMDEQTQTRMVLGDAAIEQGVDCRDISDRTPGVAWVAEEGRTGYTRVRAFEVTNTDITTLATLFATPPRPVDLDAFDTTDNKTDDFDDLDGRDAA